MLASSALVLIMTPGGPTSGQMLPPAYAKGLLTL
jgi:hypothetical protein